MSLIPSAFVAEFLPSAPPGGRALDVACGGGRHTLLARSRGYEVVAIDRDVAALQQLAAGDGGITAIAADLEAAPWPLAGATFAAVIVVNYLWRPLLPGIVAAVAPGGVLLYETFAVGHEQYGRPRRPEFLLREGELLQAVAGELEVLCHAHGAEGTPISGVRQRLAARRPERAG